MVSRKSSSRKVDEAVSRSVSFELTIADIAKRSERRAWWVAFTAIAMALILAGGYFYMLPLKQKVPYLVMADAYTGTATVARLGGDFAMRGVTTREAVNRSNVAHFVLARESYDLALVNLRDWKTVQTMASPGVKAEYTALFSSTNPAGWAKLYGQDQSITGAAMRDALKAPHAAQASAPDLLVTDAGALGVDELRTGVSSSAVGSVDQTVMESRAVWSASRRWGCRAGSYSVLSFQQRQRIRVQRAAVPRSAR